MVETMESTQPRHPIRVVAQRTGLSAEVLRAWERRYGVVSPSRTETGQRLYTDADIERLRLLRRVTSSGRSIGQVADLSTVQLAALVREDDGSRTPSPSSVAEGSTLVVTTHLEQAKSAVRMLDAPRLDAALMRGLVVLPAESFLDEVVAPLLRYVGDQWSAGVLNVAHEHMASAVVRRVLSFMAESAETSAAAPALVAATPAGQRHEFGALLAAAAAGALGWRVLYLGADLPASDIAAAVRQFGASAVALSMVFPASDPAVANELVRLRRLLGNGLPMLVGGPAISRYSATLESVKAVQLGSLAELRATLREIDGNTTD